ncbi:TonB-dependent receptor [Sphingosinicella sp.]|uniref:TonB-dependent receptor n=1 Tax=Sphingosinicella sp. TaxID=1917971 RepID=UPI0040376B4C
MKNVRGALLAAGRISASLFVASAALAQDRPPDRPREQREHGPGVDDDDIVVRGYRPSEEGLSAPQSALPLLDTPRTITVVEDELLEEQGQRTLRDSLRNITGISIQAGEGNPPGGGDAFSVRGFSARDDVLRDGMRDVGNYFRDPFNNQRIEVTKGPASAFAGRGNVGGTVNLISRYPVLDDGATVELTAGTHDLYRAALDSNFILSSELGAAIRFNAMANSNDVPGRDYTRNRRWAINPAVAIGIDTGTELSLHWLHLEQDDIPDYGIPNGRQLSLAGTAFAGRPLPVRRSNYYGYSNDYADVAADVVTLRLDHQFSDVLSLRSQSRYGRASNDSVIHGPVVSGAPTTIDATTTVFGRAKMRDQVDQLWINQTNLTWAFGSQTIWHTLVGGFEISRETAENRRRLDANGPVRNLFDPPLQAAPVIPFNGTRARQDTDTLAFYLFDTIEIGERFRVLAGLRFDDVETRVRGFDDTGLFPGFVTDLSVSDSNWSYNLGLVYKPTPGSSLYVAYGTSFEPSGRVEVVQLAGGNNNPPVTAFALGVDPERSEAWELGGRIELLGGRATLSAALFRIDRANVRTTGSGPADPAIALDGAQRSEGFEMQLVGELLPGWNLLFGYSWLDGEIRRSSIPGETGRRLDNLPRHSLNLWTSYRVTPQLLVGGGIQHVGSRNIGRPGFLLVTVPAYTTADLFAEYRLSGRARVRVNVFNITNEYYFQSFWQDYAIPAPARSTSATLILDF